MQQLEKQVLEAERRAYEANQQVNASNTFVDISSNIWDVLYVFDSFELWFCSQRDIQTLKHINTQVINSKDCTSLKTMVALIMFIIKELSW